MTRGIVFDASVVINIMGSGQARMILSALPGSRVVVEVTSREVKRHPLDPRSKADPLLPLVENGLLELIALPDEALTRFMELIGAPSPEGLDDGEAAALAAAEVLGFSLAIDEAKGRRVAQARVPAVELLSSSEIFGHEAIGTVLGQALAEALFSALLNARMRVLPEHDAWVRGVLGAERVAQCPSLRRRGS